MLNRRIFIQTGVLTSLIPISLIASGNDGFTAKKNTFLELEKLIPIVENIQLQKMI